MYYKSRLKKYFIILCIIFLIDEICIVHRTQTIAPVALAVPIAYEVALAGATALGAIYSAYLVSQLTDNALKIHSCYLPAVAQELRTIYPVVAQGQGYTSQEIEQELEKAIESSTFKAPYQSNKQHTEFEQEIHNKIKSEIIAPVVARTTYLNCSAVAPIDLPTVQVAAPASTIVVSYHPGIVRVDFTHLNTYASIGLSQGEVITPVRQQLILQDQQRAMDVAMAAYTFEHCQAYRNDFFSRFEAVQDTLYDTNRINPIKRIYARFALPQLHLEEPFNYILQKVIDELIPLYFDSDGMLIHIKRDFGYDRQFSIAKFLANGTSENYYKKQIKKFNLHHVKAHEESHWVSIKNNLLHIVTGRWVPNLRYPADIRIKISQNGHNQNIKNLLYYCENHNFIGADNFIKNFTNPIYRNIYTECYNYYIHEYCDEYGIQYCYSKDPLWTQLSHSAKQEIAKDIHAITEQNAALALRAIQKKVMQEIWHIADESPCHVHQALYDLIEYPGTGLKFIAKVHEILDCYGEQEREHLVQALFLPNGILKDFSHFEQAQVYDFPSEIFTVERSEDLKRINELLYIAHVFKETDEGEAALIELDQLYINYNSLILDQEDQAPPYLFQVTGDGGGAPVSGGPSDPNGKPPRPDGDDEDEVDSPESPDEDNKSWEEEKPRDWSPEEAESKLKQLNNPPAIKVMGLVGLTYEQLKKAYKRFASIKGFLSKNGPFQKFIKNFRGTKGKLDTARGAGYEIKTANRLYKYKDKIIEFGRKADNAEVDIITQTKWIECKHWTWNKVTANRLNKLFSDSGRVRSLAQRDGKVYEICFSNKVPQSVKDRLVNMGISIFEG